MKNLKKNCPHCRSEKVAPIPQRTIARIIRYVYPRQSYLCLDCRKHFGQFENPLKTLSAKLMAGFAVVLILLAVVAMLPGIRKSPPEKTASPMQVATQHSEPEAMRIPKMPATEAVKPPPTEEATGNVLEDRITDSEAPPLPVDQKTTSPADSMETQADVTTTDKPSMTAMTESVSPEQPVAETIPPAIPAPSQPDPPAEIKTETVTSFTKAAQSRKLKYVDIQNAEGSTKMHILADGPIDAYHFFMLPSPPRLVIDLEGKWEKPKFYGMEVEHDLIKMFRLWNYEKKLRIVGDLRENRKLEPVFETTADGLVVTLGRTAP